MCQHPSKQLREGSMHMEGTLQAAQVLPKSPGMEMPPFSALPKSRINANQYHGLGSFRFEWPDGQVWQSLEAPNVRSGRKDRNMFGTDSSIRFQLCPSCEEPCKMPGARGQPCKRMGQQPQRPVVKPEIELPIGYAEKKASGLGKEWKENPEPREFANEQAPAILLICLDISSCCKYGIICWIEGPCKS